MNFGWEYPPGVTGNEPEIAGWPECPKCNADVSPHDDTCHECGATWQVGPDPDELRDRELDRQWEEEQGYE